MIVTEEEAKTKRCQESFPAAHGISPDGASYVSSWHYPPPPMGGASPVHTAPTNCIGSACMAWRWKRGSVYIPDLSQPNHFTEIEDRGEYSTTLGYCGKACRP